MNSARELSIGLTLLVCVAAEAAAQAYDACEIAWLYPDVGASDDAFGFAVAAEGELAAVSAFRYDGAWDLSGGVFVYRVIDGRVEFETLLQPDPGGLALGQAIACSGERLLASSLPLFLFERVAGSWSIIATLWPEEPIGNIHFGNALAIDGDLAVVGAPFGGPTFVFERQPDGSWPEVAQLYSSDFNPNDNFGWSVDISGETIVVGARDEGEYAGAAYVFERALDGSWNEAAKLLPHDVSAFAAFGVSVAVQTNEIAVGAQEARHDGVVVGATYVYHHRPSGEWVEQQKLIAIDAHLSQAFGSAVEFTGERLLVGAENDNTNGAVSGCAYLFERGEDGIWRQIGKLVPEEGAPYDKAGSAVALGEDFALIGAPDAEIHAPYSGCAYVFATGPDVNGNDVADPCECLADINGDGVVGQRDLGVLLSTYELDPGSPLHDPRADVNSDGVIDQTDLSILLAEYETVCPR
jgi:FG-GAP repeat/Dockerin type I domain